MELSVTGTLPPPRCGNSATMVEKRLLVYGGRAKNPAHSSVGGFVSHCGWSSVIESLKSGIPIIAMPMHHDQPLIARLVVDVGVGLEVRRDNKDGSLEGEEIAKVIRDVVLGDEKDAEGVRRKAREMRNHVEKKGEKEMDDLVEQLIQLCRMKPSSCYLSN